MPPPPASSTTNPAFPLSMTRPLLKLGTIYLNPQVEKLVFNFNDPLDFPDLLQHLPMHEETLKILNNFVRSDIKLQKFLGEMRWDILRDNLKNMHFEDALILKLIVINFRLLSNMFDFEHFDEIFDVLNEIEVARAQDVIPAQKMSRWADILGVFLVTLGEYVTPHMLEVIADPLKVYIDGIRGEIHVESLKANLKFVLALTTNSHFMFWAKQEMFDLFNLMEKNIERPFVDLETVELAVKIHHNLLINLDYSRAFFDDPQRVERLANSVFALDLAPEKWMKNIVILSYLNPKGLNMNYSAFLYKLNSQLFAELEDKNRDLGKVNTIIEMMRKFSSNIFRQENESLIRQILDINLAKLLVKTLKLARSSEPGAVNVKEVLSMLSLFIVDDEIVDYFLKSNLSSDLFFLMKDERLDSKAAVVNLITVQIHLFRLKSYAFSKNSKLDFLVFVLRQYEKSDDEEFKDDVVKLLGALYEINEFKKLLNDEEIVIEVKYRTEINELEDFIQNELVNGNYAREDRRPNAGTKVFEARDEWANQFPIYKVASPDSIGTINPEALEQIQREEKLKIEGDRDQDVLMELKLKSVQDFLRSLDSMRLDYDMASKVRKTLEDFADLRDLINIRMEGMILRAKARLSDLEKENKGLRDIIDGFHAGGAANPSPELRSSFSNKETSFRIGTNNTSRMTDNRSPLVGKGQQRPPSNAGIGSYSISPNADVSLERNYPGTYSSALPQLDKDMPESRGVSRDMQQGFSKFQSAGRSRESSEGKLPPANPNLGQLRPEENRAGGLLRKYPQSNNKGDSRVNESVNLSGASDGRLPPRMGYINSVSKPVSAKQEVSFSIGERDKFMPAGLGRPNVTNTPIPGSVVSSGLPLEADKSALRARIEQQEKKIAELVNMQEASNRKEIALMVENRKLKSIVNNDPTGFEESPDRDFKNTSGIQQSPRGVKWVPGRKRGEEPY